MLNVERLQTVFCPVEVLGIVLMAKGNQNEQTLCVTV